MGFETFEGADLITLVEIPESRKRHHHVYVGSGTVVKVACPKCGWKGSRQGEECACYDEYAMYCRPDSPGPGCPSGVRWPCPKCGATPEVVHPGTFMKALSLKHPWAFLVMIGWKTIETRTWKTNYRGTILIHNGMKWVNEAEAEADPVSRDFVIDGTLFYTEKYKGTNVFYYPGGILGTVELVDCRPMTKEDEPKAGVSATPGRYAWVLKNPKPFYRPVKLRGQLGLFNVKRSLVHAEITALTDAAAAEVLRKMQLDKKEGT